MIKEDECIEMLMRVVVISSDCVKSCLQTKMPDNKTKLHGAGADHSTEWWKVLLLPPQACTLSGASTLVLPQLGYLLQLHCAGNDVPVGSSTISMAECARSASPG